MFLKLVGCLCVCFFFLGARAQRAWGSSSGGSYNSAFSNSWNSNNGFSINNNRPSVGNVNNAGSWESNAFGFGGRPNEKPSASPSERNPNWGFETSQNSDNNSGRRQGKPAQVNGGVSTGRQSDSSRRPNEKKPSSITNLLDPSKGGTDTFPSDEDNNLAFSSWASSNGRQPSSGYGGSQSSKPDNWNSDSLKGNQPNENEIPTEYEDNSGYSSWDSNKKKNKPASSSSGGSGNWESTTQKNNKNSGTSKLESGPNYKPLKPTGGWNSGDASQSGKEKPPVNTDGHNVKPSTLDTSILDELDKNDWYFGKESNYPKPPFRSTLNIDVSQLWNFDKNKKPSLNSKGNGYKNNNNNNNSINNNNNNNNNSNNVSNYKDNSNNNFNNNNNNRNTNSNNINNYKNNNKNKYTNNNTNNNRRWNRQIEGSIRIECECVDVNLCDEEDMIMTQEDVKFDSRPLEQFRCDKLTEVCCTNPKMIVANRANIEEKEQLRCGERRLGENQFAELGDNIAEPGEFPWNLRLENAENNCSASLIHHKMALTVAHCVAGALPGELTLKAGVWNRNDEPQQSRKVVKIIPHPDYNSRNPRNDIALLILETPFELTDNVNTICLPVTNDKWDSNQCVVAGWKPKKIDDQNLQVLEQGIVNFLPQRECQSIMLVTDLWRNYIFHDSFVCGLEKTGRKSCTGDEGGFVVCPSKKKPDTYIQIGIVSKGMNCDEFGRPGIFTNVLIFLDWINKTFFELGLLDEIDIRGLSE